MKKYLFLTSIFLVFSACAKQQLEENAPNQKDTEKYQQETEVENQTDWKILNTPNLSFQYPSTAEFGLGPGIDEEFIKQRGIESVTIAEGCFDPVDNRYLNEKYSVEITIHKRTKLTASTLEYAKNAEKLNKQEAIRLNSNNPGEEYAVTDGKEETFLGIPAYTFEVKGAFAEGGHVLTGNGMEDSNPNAIGESALLYGYSSKCDGKLDRNYKVIYFELNDSLYRIIYAVNDETAEQIVSSFTLPNIQE